tara:strand:+ start:771 stop:1232 length:462 start_codon:yes stop_codon:yes gene_type:complete
MDDYDKKILNLLQTNANIPLSDLSKKVGISTTPCWNRIKKMEEEGVIKSKVAILNNEKINLPIIVFLSISVKSHQKEWISQFNETIMKYDQITEVYRLASSTSDYLLKIVAPSIDAYDEFQQELITQFDFSNMTSNITLKELKKVYSLPLNFI